MEKEEYENWGVKQCNSMMNGYRCGQPVTDKSEYCYYCNKLNLGLLKPTNDGVFEDGIITYPKIISRKVKG